MGTLKEQSHAFALRRWPPDRLAASPGVGSVDGHFEIAAGGNRTVTNSSYFDNPGMRMYHCYILEHAEAGMMAMVEVQPPAEP